MMNTPFASLPDTLIKVTAVLTDALTVSQTIRKQKHFVATNNLTQNYRTTKRRRLEWLQHVIKMDQRRVAKERLQRKSEDRIEVRRSGLRWLEDVENDLLLFKLNRWRQRQMTEKNGHLS
jgi:hypothetical protein